MTSARVVQTKPPVLIVVLLQIVVAGMPCALGHPAQVQAYPAAPEWIVRMC
eukprot:CAMPEP_0204480928 /NCGR_PEP_ID=MMETSP0471-20130131/45198_1 /ASSEMBLY_ACC=CAM_ASM_000602 /TAXON_ID=2969 /ORGANISM="Oxyrrhis marina" /LENGTH=50 /DNA_ID=CAMNT_0051484021 /DNA_START=1 /DNA_END=151 /DNA_ORIENTATION=+